ncbi:MAG: glycoside hydrolase family 16 protein [Planctomycetes bacterium]|nr:glycoside hydrolase family 16 protein [Planctomycetota bacterium]
MKAGAVNQELQRYTNLEENASMAEGILTLRCLKKDNEYTSARLISKGKGDFKYVRVEVRAKLPGGRGTWPAIWMMPTHSIYGGWPKSGEIDIMEYVGYQKDMIHGTAHCLDYYFKEKTQKSKKIKHQGVTQEFNVYALEWYPDRLEYYMNDRHYFTIHREYKGWTKWPYSQDFYLILNIAFGGSWGGVKGIDDSLFNRPGGVNMQIDYVRVYDLGIRDVAEMAPTPPKGIELSYLKLKQVKCSWQPSIDDHSVAYYEVWVNGQKKGQAKKHSLILYGTPSHQDLKVQIKAFDEAGNNSTSKDKVFRLVDSMIQAK